MQTKSHLYGALGLTQSQFIQLVVNAHMANWELVQDSAGLKYATFVRKPWREDMFSLFNQEGSHHVAYSQKEGFSGFPELLAWVSNSKI